jgi:hypothetical protein
MPTTSAPDPTPDMSTLCRAVIESFCLLRFAGKRGISAEAALDAQMALGEILLVATEPERRAFVAACAAEAGPGPKPGDPPGNEVMQYIRGLPGELCLDESGEAEQAAGMLDDPPLSDNDV